MICTGPSNVRMSATYISMFTSRLVLLSATTYQLYSYHDKQDGPHVPPPRPRQTVSVWLHSRLPCEYDCMIASGTVRHISTS